MKNIIFAGTPQIAATLLEALVQAKFPISHVYTQPDRPTGRGQHVQHTPVKDCAIQHSIPVLQPENFKDPRQVHFLSELKPDLMIVVAYGLLLPQAVLSIPQYGCINVHFSLLPRWRGAAPVQRAIQAGDAETGVSIMQLDSGLDTGPILAQARCKILPQETSEQLLNRLTQCSIPLLSETLNHLVQGNVAPHPQDNVHATYAKKIDKGEAHIDWQQSAANIAQLIYAFNPWPIAFTLADEARIKIFAATVSAATTRAQPGEIVRTSKAGIEVATGNGVLCITQLQLPNRRVMTAQEVLNAHQVLFAPGKVLQ